ncbi:MAG TPA: acetyl-CoA C-acetyltransferase [Clostridia bacterium]|nr:acetyl-CoA C-acetyltransferase [Clostridia bacterium]
MKKEIVIVEGARTPVGSYGGSLKDLQVYELGAIAIEAALERAKVSKELVGEVIIGTIAQTVQGHNPARTASLTAGLPIETPAYTVNKLCGSGLKAVELAYLTLLAGHQDIVVAGGMESMSNYPYLSFGSRWGERMGDGRLIDALIYTLTDPFCGLHMGGTAENVAEMYGITREEQDEFAYQSHKKAVAAIADGRLLEEVVPVEIKDKKGSRIFKADEGPRSDISLEALAKLKPVFKQDGTVTAGNASSINDGASALVMMTGEKAEELGLRPLARILSFGSAAVDPAVMGIGPIPATEIALKRAGLTLEQIELIELNEAFAAQSLGVIKGLGLNKEIVNVNGGAISIGHPLGMSGNRILLGLLYEMRRRKLRYGLASLCIGGGQGITVVVENIYN